MKEYTLEIQNAGCDEYVELRESLVLIAQKWREANQEYKGGVVLVWQGNAYGWKDKLRDPAHEKPGAFAVDSEGHVFIAEGGNEYDGAKCWVAFTKSGLPPVDKIIEEIAGNKRPQSE